MSPGAAAIVARGLTKSYGSCLAIPPTDVDVPVGTALALRGPNGAGKSTLLRILAGISRPTAGQLLLHGLDAARDPDAARRQTAWAGPDAPCYAELTPREHLAWWARLHASPASIPGLLAESGLAGVADRPASGLSRGERQRLSLALAFATDAPTLLLDEPFTGLDAQGSGWLRARLAAHLEGQGAIVLALHGEEFAAQATLRLGPHEAGGRP